MAGRKGLDNRTIVDTLKNRGFQIEYVDEMKIPNPLKLRGFDIVYGACLQTCSRYLMAAQMLGKKSGESSASDEQEWNILSPETQNGFRGRVEINALSEHFCQPYS